MQFLVLLSIQALAAVSQVSALCKLLPGDAKWPAPDVWKNALPGVVALEKSAEDNSTRRPDYQLTVTKVEQVQAAVKFTAEHNIRLTILNSGVDFLGRSDGPSGLSLMVGNFKGVRVSDSYVPLPAGVPNVNYTADPIADVNVIKTVPGKQAFVTFGVGVTSQQLNNALEKSKLFTMAAAASSPKVAGGFSQTAGHGPFTNKYGLAADNVVEYKVVTADGKLRVANAVSEPDLFWSLRGGGGGTFGVVVEATMKAFPSPRITMTRWYLKTIDPNDTTSIYEPTAYVLSQLPLLSEQFGVQGYFFLYPSEMWVTMLTADEQSGIPLANKTWQPILDKLSTFKGVKRPIYIHTNLPNFKSFFDALFGPLEIVPNAKRALPGSFTRRFRRNMAELEEAYPRGIIPMDSRLLGQAHLSSPDLANALRESMPHMESGMLRGHLTAGGRVLNPIIDAITPETSVNPAWRKAWIHLIGTGGGFPNVTALKKLAPDSGCYSNECSFTEGSFKETMWGSNYAKLLSVKTKYDPDGLFWVSPGIGADQFTANATDGRVCPVEELTSGGAGNGSPAPLFDNKNMGAHESTEYQLGPESQEVADKEAAAAAAALEAAIAKAKGSTPPPVAVPPPAAVTPSPKSSASPKSTIVPKSSSALPKGKGTPRGPAKGMGKGFPKGKGTGGNFILSDYIVE